MTPTTHRSLALLLVTALLIPATTTWAQSNAQQQFERAYFLESHEGDLESATDLYKKVAGDRTAPAKLTAEAKRRWGSCREELRSRDLATLMPPNAMAYLEIGQPGQHVENLADMLGLIGDPLSNLTGSVQRVPIPDSPGLAIPAEIFISPALIEQAKRFRGLAVALTGFAPPPAGNPDLGGAQALLVLHPGDAAEVRGLIETVAQFVEPTEPVGGFATIQAKPGITICFTHRLVIVGTSRDLVAGAVDRLTSFERDSLANRPDFKALAEQRTHALLFAFVDAKKTVQTVARMSGGNPDARQALGIAYGTLDAAHMQSLSLALGSSAKGLYADFAMAMDDGHNNFIYNLLRTPPLNGASLNSVPAGSAVVLAMGVNPAATPQDTERAQQQADRLRTFTGLDIGRELFANIREIALFVVPGERREDTHIPDAGLVIASNDAQKSQIVWEQLLSIPARVMGKELAEPDTKTLAGTPVQIYPLHDDVSIHVARLDNRLILAPSETAITAAIGAHRTGQSILTDTGVEEATARIGKDTSLLLLAHAGRCAQLGAQFCPAEELPQVTMAQQILGSTLFTLQADEAPNRFRLAANLSGLPKVKDLIANLPRLMAAAGCNQANPDRKVAAIEPKE